jgi:hypothetical protein
MTGDPEDVVLCDPVRATYPDYDLALRPDETGMLDDVVVNRPMMFRAEMMDDKSLWMCCYMGNGNERVTFWVTVKKGKLNFAVTEWPEGEFTYEEGSVSG